MTTAFVFFLCWSTAGVATAWWMARRGHNFWLFAAMGIAYGPLTAIVGAATTRGRSTDPTFVAKGTTWHADGWLDVLIGLDGTDAAVESAARLLDRFGPAVRDLHLASVLDHEISDSLDAFTGDDERLVYLQTAADTLGVPQAELALLSGPADRALADHAEANSIDVIVVGHGTRRMASLVQGSTVAGLTRGAALPILVMPHAD